MGNPEHTGHSPEHGIEVAGNTARERSAELASSPETSIEQSPDRRADRIESARRSAHETAVSVEASGTENGANAGTAHSVRPLNSRAARNKAYKDILHHTQLELEPVSRAFSKVIHQPVIEKTSTVIGATVARPNAILFGALFAFLISGGVYLLARHYGYGLSGFEAIGSFAVGWIVGLLIDVVRVAFRRH